MTDETNSYGFSFKSTLSALSIHAFRPNHFKNSESFHGSRSLCLHHPGTLIKRNKGGYALIRLKIKRQYSFIQHTG